MSLITDAEFVDLYLGEDFADVKGLRGTGTRRVPVPKAWSDVARQQRASLWG